MAHLGAFKSNHTPILLDTNPEDSFAHRPFRFEAAWIRDSGCNSIVEKAWNMQNRGSAFFKLFNKQANTKDALLKWNKEVFGHCQARINLLMDKIVKVQKNPPSEHNGKVEEELQLELSKWLFRSEIMWKQKSRELWLKEGDRNTKFFHLSTIIKRRTNHIDAIKLEEGHWVTSPTQIRQTILSSFKNLFAEEYVSFLEHLDNLMTNCIIEEDNDLLMKIPSREEIKETLFQMHDLKAPRPDGFPALFYSGQRSGMQSQMQFYLSSQMVAYPGKPIALSLCLSQSRPTQHQLITSAL